MQITVLLPAYMPGTTMIDVVKELHSKDFTVLVVNDGSGSDYAPVFDAVSPYAKIVTHEHNMGKGAALKTGFKAIPSVFPETEAVITADADGQHSVKDICRVADELSKGAACVITERHLGRDIPLRSKFGNDLSRFVYAASTGRYIYDTQSGLRGFSIQQLSWLVNVKGVKYDYEMGVLLHIDKMNLPITRMDIETIYIDGNSSSHFNPIKDTLRIYKRFAVTLLPSLISYILNIVSSIVCLAVFGCGKCVPILLCSCLFFTVLSVIFNRLLIFKKMSIVIAGKMALLSFCRVIFSLFICLAANMTGFSCIVAYVISIVLLLPLQYLLPYIFKK